MSWPKMRAFRTLALVLALGTGFAAGAEPLASYRAKGYSITLLTEACASAEGKGLQRALKRAGPRSVEGCWFANERNNPVLAWSDGGPPEELDGSLFEMTPKYAAVLQEGRDPAAAEREVRGSFPRPAWCRNARQPHERLICRDRELSAEDLKLGSLWQSYRTEQKLTRSQETRHKNEFYQRLKACGTDKECISNEQAARILFYRDALGRE